MSAVKTGLLLPLGARRGPNPRCELPVAAVVACAEKEMHIGSAIAAVEEGLFAWITYYWHGKPLRDNQNLHT